RAATGLQPRAISCRLHEGFAVQPDVCFAVDAIAAGRRPDQTLRHLAWLAGQHAPRRHHGEAEVVLRPFIAVLRPEGAREQVAAYLLRPARQKKRQHQTRPLIPPGANGAAVELDLEFTQAVDTHLAPRRPQGERQPHLHYAEAEGNYVVRDSLLSAAFFA